MKKREDNRVLVRILPIRADGHCAFHIITLGYALSRSLSHHAMIPCYQTLAVEARKIVVQEFERRAAVEDLSCVFGYWGFMEEWKTQIGSRGWGALSEMQLGLAASPSLVVVLDADTAIREPNAALEQVLEYNTLLHRAPETAKTVVFAVWHDRHFSLAMFQEADTWTIHVPIRTWEHFGRALLASLRGGCEIGEWKFAPKTGNAL
jgi:hypothetical protein